MPETIGHISVEFGIDGCTLKVVRRI